MKKYILIAIIVVAGIFYFMGIRSKLQTLATVPNNEKVMFGYKSYDEYVTVRSEELKAVDDKFLNSVIKGPTEQDRKDAAKGGCQLGYNYALRGDNKTAIKRFNQSWLIMQENACAFSGFGYYLIYTEKDFENGFAMYEKALAQADKTDLGWMGSDYAEAYDYCYELDNKRNDCLDKAFEIAQQSLKDEDSPKIHRVLSFIYFHKADFSSSWGHLHQAIDGGVPKEVFGEFINDLKKQKPDPKGKY